MQFGTVNLGTHHDPGRDFGPPWMLPTFSNIGTFPAHVHLMEEDPFMAFLPPFKNTQIRDAYVSSTVDSADLRNTEIIFGNSIFRPPEYLSISYMAARRLHGIEGAARHTAFQIRSPGTTLETQRSPKRARPDT